MPSLVLGGSAVVPSCLLLWYIYARDKNPEPRGMLLKTFLLGALICVPVVPVAMMLQSLGRGFTGDMWGDALVKAFLGAAIPEELFKFLVLRAFVWNRHHFDEPLDGVVYGATASLGFATLENLLYVEMYGMGTAVLRAVTAVPGHAFTGVVMGAFVGRARFAAPEQRSQLLWAGFGWAVLLHGAYDAFLFTGTDLAFLALAVLFIEVSWGRKLYKALQAEQVLMPVPALASPMLAGSVALAEQVMVRPGGMVTSEAHATVSVGVTEAAVYPRRRAVPERTAWSWSKLVLGGLGLSLCGLWWLFVAAVLLLSQGDAGLLSSEGKWVLILISLIPTLTCLWLFRSGLRGPFTSA